MPPSAYISVTGTCGEIGNKTAAAGVYNDVPEAARGNRVLSFCPDCFRALAQGESCMCHIDGAEPPEVSLDEVLAGYRVAVDSPRSRVLTDTSRKLVPAVAAAGVLGLVALVAAIIS